MMEIKSIGYQNRARKGLRRRRDEGFKSGLLVLATGLGKTVVAALDAHEFILEHPGRVLFLCHDVGIMKRQLLTFQAVFGKEFGFGFLTARRRDFNANFLFATFQSMKGNLHKFSTTDFQYIIVDESHHSSADTYEPSILYFNPGFLLGMTATPDREDLKDIRVLYGKEVINISLPVALARNYLTSVDYRLIANDFDQKLLEVSDAELLKGGVKNLNRLFTPSQPEDVIAVILEKIAEVENPKVCVFCDSIDQADEYAHNLPNAVAYHSSISGQRQDDNFDIFNDGDAQFITTVDKFNEGIDIPHINVLVFLRSTASRRILYQQLGRGLRKVKGKKKVLVLDFAGNIHRISMIDQLRKSVQRERDKIQSAYKERSTGSRNQGSISPSSFQFSERILDILELLDKVRPILPSADKEALITELKMVSERIGRTPRTRDIEKLSIQRICHHSFTYRKIFGSFNAALTAAGFTPSLIRSAKTDESEMLNKLKQLAADLGRTPTLSDLKTYTNQGRVYSETMYRSVFGTYNNAVVLAGLRVNQETEVVTAEELIGELKAIVVELGRVPIKDDLLAFSAVGKAHSETAYIRLFGTWNKALSAAGFEPSFRRSAPATKEELINELKALYVELGRVPQNREIDTLSKQGRTHSVSAYRRLFGTLSNALKEAGLI